MSLIICQLCRGIGTIGATEQITSPGGRMLVKTSVTCVTCGGKGAFMRLNELYMIVGRMVGAGITRKEGEEEKVKITVEANVSSCEPGDIKRKVFDYLGHPVEVAIGDLSGGEKEYNKEGADSEE